MDKILLGADINGLELKNKIKHHLIDKGLEVYDIGMSDEKIEIPYYEVAAIAAKNIQSGDVKRAILFCGTGMGVSIVANKFKGIYASVVESEFTGKMSKIINNSNVITLGGRIISEHKAKLVVDQWLAAEHTKGFWDPEAVNFLRESLIEIRKIEKTNFK